MKWSRHAMSNFLSRATASAVLPALAATLLAGCAVPYGKQIELVKPFDQDQALAQLREGANTIDGKALLLHPFGGASNCSGQQVVLVPATAYADERMAALYGPSRQGVVWPPVPTFQPDVLGYHAASRSTTCGIKGDFRFEKVADGDFYLVAIVPWRPRPSVVQEASLAQKISLRGGKRLSVEMLGKP